MKNNPIVIVDDDIDDCEMLSEILTESGVSNDIRCFENGLTALEYLKATSESPCVIISDINMPKMNGLEFRQSIIEDISLRMRKIPFIFLSTSKEKNLVQSALQLSIQGYFQKPNNFQSLKEIAKSIIGYWKNCCF